MYICHIFNSLAHKYKMKGVSLHPSVYFSDINFPIPERECYH